MEREDKEIGAIAAALTVVLLIGSLYMWRDKMPAPAPEMRAAVHHVCPAGGEPMQFSADPLERAGQEVGLTVSTAFIESQPLFARVKFCAALMWK